MSLPDPKPVLDLIEAFRHSKTMFTAEALGIFDRLHECPATAAELADELKLHAAALERRLLRIVGVVETGLFIGMAEQAMVASAQGVTRYTPRNG